MDILSAAEMGAADRRSVESGIPLATLMHNAGRAVAVFCEKHFPGTGPVVVLCGKGNNGGDGFVAAQHLAHSGRTVHVALFGHASELKSEPAATAYAALRDCNITEIADEASLIAVLDGASLILDAVVGTGFQPPLRGLAATAQRLLSLSTVPVVAVDLPSGWDADSLTERAEAAFRANAVVTFTAPKFAHVLGHLTPGHTFGPVVVSDIGSPAAAIQSIQNLTWAGASKRIAEPPRDPNGNKGKFGHVLIVGGAWGKAGAPAMASLAALRSGAGLVTAAVPASILPLVAAITPELMCVPLAERDGIVELANAAPPSLDKLLKGIRVVALGPGLGTDGEASEFVRALVGNVTLPLVLDADALNAFAGKTSLLRDAASSGRTLVLTPHPGEMARLTGLSVAAVEADRIGVARRFATDHGVTLVLKGWRTLIAHPDGRIAVNTTGNPSMAKGGSGDILTGIVAALLAQYPADTAAAVEAAVFLHGLAGDFAALAQDQHTVLATDTVAHLWQAFRAHVRDPEGFTWIAGLAANERPQ